VPELRFSLLFFANHDNGDVQPRYDLLFRASRFADEHGFEAVWIPERHFHPFGGAFPNPALAAAAIASVTTRLRLRAGSVVLPLHDPLTVAEDWSVVDNISGGRVDLSFAVGWNADDFVLAPDRYAERDAVLLQLVSDFDRLWRGESIKRANGEGAEVDVRVFPRPVQPPMRHWLTCTASRNRFVEAGRSGFNVLTALLFQTPDELKSNIDAYRAARGESGREPSEGRVTLMLHTYLTRSAREALDAVREPFTRYLESSVSLWKHRWKELDQFDERGKDMLLRFAFQRYSRSAALFGTPESCAKLVETLRAAGVDEIAALIDFGLDHDAVLAGLANLVRLKDRLSPKPY
jgi:natural product biosynthesis luciferase-like monooxygenase protein